MTRTFHPKLPNESWSEEQEEEKEEEEVGTEFQAIPLR